MEILRSACGIYGCDGCEHVISGDCPGCAEGNRRLKESCEQVCAVFECAETHGITSCGDCSEPSCLQKRNVEMVCPLRSRFESMRWWAGRMSRALESRKVPELEPEQDIAIPPRVVNRLRLYLTALGSLTEEGATSVSSWQLAERVGVNAALIRKDLSRFGDFGTPSLGYRIDFLTQTIRKILHLDERKGLVWIGAACFGLHLPALSRLQREGCRVAAVLDTEPGVIGCRVGGLEVLPVEQLPQIVADSDVRVAVLAVSGTEAKAVADTLVRLGVKAILNVTGELLVLPDNVRVSNLDPIGELLELCYYCEK